MKYCTRYQGFYIVLPFRFPLISQRGLAVPTISTIISTSGCVQYKDSADCDDHINREFDRLLC